MNLNYLSNIWQARYFWTHLALADIRAKYRRSSLGLLWALIQPLSLTLLFSFVMGNFFKVPMHEYAPFIFSGLIFWEFIVSSTVGGCLTFVGAEGYIKQFTHPLLIYTLRTIIPNLVNMLCALVGLVLWVVVTSPENFNLTWLAIIPSLLCLCIFTWPMTTISAFIGVRFRDLSQLIIIFLQAIYYVSPILFKPDMFYHAKMGFLVDFNPLFHLLNLFRMPLLHGMWPTTFDYMYTIIIATFFWLIAWLFVRNSERKVIFYL